MPVLSPRAKVLILDDNSLCRDLTKRVLERVGIEVLTISTHIGFGLVLHKEKPDLALVEICMPTLSGAELIGFVRRRLGSACQMVLYSERPQAELSALAEQCGAAGYIRKTNDWSSVAESVARFLSVSGELARS